ncbi:MAG: GtrA family protein [Erysipelotrichaceae bacterium]|nr:GtrA family protein [Erysipelotrichaceae bacterium]
MEEKKDIFDKIMELPVIRIFQPIYKKYKSVLVYLFLGGCATIVGFVTRTLFIKGLNMNSYLGVALSWIISTTFAFFTNRTWVFEHNDEEMLKEYFKFCGGRILTFFIDEIINGIFYEFLGWNYYVVFLISSAITAIANYLISKFFVFKQK